MRDKPPADHHKIHSQRQRQRDFPALPLLRKDIRHKESILIKHNIKTMKKVHNFTAGPCALPQVAIDKAIEALKDFKGTGIPVISIGIPTVVNAATIVNDTLDLIIGSLKENADAINNKQDSLNAAQLDAVNSGITSEDVAQIETNKNKLNNKAE